jgi:hypothetical protein
MNNEALNLLAMTADAEARATATLVEMVAAASLLKLNPPVSLIDVVDLTISQADMEELMRSHSFETSYEPDGTMTLRLRRLPA